jgi:hypothetical protein
MDDESSTSIAAPYSSAAGSSEHFTAPGDELERLMYGFSITHCLPVGRTESESAATGTVMRPSALRNYALEAGFSRVEVLPIEHEMWRFYRLRA